MPNRKSYNRFCDQTSFRLSGLAFPYQQNTVFRYFFTGGDPDTNERLNPYLDDPAHRITIGAAADGDANGLWSMRCKIYAPDAPGLMLDNPHRLYPTDAVDMAILLADENALVHQSLGMDYTPGDPELLDNMHYNLQSRRLSGIRPFIISGNMVVLDEEARDMAAYLNGFALDDEALRYHVLNADAACHDAERQQVMARMDTVPCVKQSFAMRDLGHPGAYTLRFISDNATYKWPNPMDFATANSLQLGIGGMFTNNAVEMAQQRAMPLHGRNWQHIPLGGPGLQSPNAVHPN